MTGNPHLTRRWPFGRVTEGLPTTLEEWTRASRVSVLHMEPLWQRRISWPQRTVSIPIKIAPAGFDSKDDNGFPQAPNGKWVLAATILGSSMAFIDGTAITVALPAT
jgi:hypothetical protein